MQMRGPTGPGTGTAGNGVSNPQAGGAAPGNSAGNGGASGSPMGEPADAGLDRDDDGGSEDGGLPDLPVPPPEAVGSAAGLSLAGRACVLSTAVDRGGAAVADAATSATAVESPRPRVRFTVPSRSALLRMS